MQNIKISREMGNTGTKKNLFLLQSSVPFPSPLSETISTRRRQRGARAQHKRQFKKKKKKNSEGKAERKKNKGNLDIEKRKLSKERRIVTNTLYHDRNMKMYCSLFSYLVYFEACCRGQNMNRSDSYCIGFHAPPPIFHKKD